MTDIYNFLCSYHRAFSGGNCLSEIFVWKSYRTIFCFHCGCRLYRDVCFGSLLWSYWEYFGRSFWVGGVSLVLVFPLTMDANIVSCSYEPVHNSSVLAVISWSLFFITLCARFSF